VDLIAHFVFGLWLSGKFGGVWTILFSCITDIDHLIGYIYDKRKKRVIEMPKLLHLAYRPRSWLHSFTGVLFFLPLLFVFDWKTIFIPLLLHLLFDSLDKYGISIFPPFTNKRLKGILPVGYLVEEPRFLELHKRSHIPSLIMTALMILLISYGI